MSPSWRNTLRIALSPERVTLVRVGKGLRPRVTEKRVEACIPGEGETWQAAITALKKLLDKQTGAVATVVLSSHFARYVTVPWSADVSSDEELTALAQHRYSQVYGTAANWEVRVSPANYAAPMLASGMEQALLGALQQSCAQAGVRLNSVQPALMAAFNCWHGELPQAGGWFGIAESGYLTLALAKNGGWHGVHSRRLDGALGEVLPVLLEQECLLANLDSVPQHALIYAPEQAALTPVAGKWSIRALRLPGQNGFSPLVDGMFGLAMCGGK